jgi:REP element-mobilizing transposase RayT
LKQFPQRRSPRLAGYDYAQQGAYFVTICTQNRVCLFGTIADGIVHPNPAYHMIEMWWHEITNKFPTVELDEWVVMPNHFHGIIVLTETSIPLSRMIQWFKVMSTNAYMNGVKTEGWTGFTGKLWQRSYHEHIIRDENSLNHIREYVRNNPVLWTADTFHSVQA